ncbi:hypothetical protein BH23CHL8_BH23CHL8_11750 [soil metagenome]
MGEQSLGWLLNEQLEQLSSVTEPLRTVERASETSVLLTEDYLALSDEGRRPEVRSAAGAALSSRATLPAHVAGIPEPDTGGALDAGPESRSARAPDAAPSAACRCPRRLDGRAGVWEAVELAVGEADTATFSLVDRETGAEGQLGATDDGSVVLDLPDD